MTAPVWQVDGAGSGYTLAPPHLLPLAVDPPAMAAACATALRDADAAGTPQAAWRGRSTAGFMLVCLGEADRAIDLLQACAEAQRQLADGAGELSSRLRLAQAWQVAGRPAEAVRVAQAAVADTGPGAPAERLHHFALHHLGKALQQAGDQVRARAALQAALALRRGLGDAGLVASTEAALALLDRPPAAPCQGEAGAGSSAAA